MSVEANPRIAISYKDRPSKAGLQIMLFASPFWALWAPYTIFWAAQSLIKGGLFSDTGLLALWLFFILLFAVCVATLFVCIQNKFEMTRQGIKFPLRCLLDLHAQLYRSWSSVTQLSFVNRERSQSAPSNNPDTMIVHFGKTRLTLELDAFSPQDLQNFILAIQSFVPDLAINPPLSQIYLPVQIEANTRQQASFTQIWEDDMASRFGSTVFVPLEPGDKLQNGRLEVLGQIAFGGLSAIYLAKHSDGQLCVVKEAVIPTSADKESAEKALQMFQREAQILMTLEHPHIARVLDHFVENERHYLLLEHIDGTDLRRYVKGRGPQSEQLVLRWAGEIAEVLDYLHKLDPPIIHRDLTPDNLVLEKNGSIVLIDFGAANQFLGTATGTLVGKQAYIAPEQFRGHAEPMSDLYALGATMYFLLTGSDPEALSQSRPLDQGAKISPECNELIAKLTAMDPGSRFSSAEELLLACKNTASFLKKEEQAFDRGRR